jgi:hypothetical protein
MRTYLYLSLIILFAAFSLAEAAPLPLRPCAGIGVLALRPQPGEEKVGAPLYREPGVERLGVAEGGSLPRLAGTAQEPLVAVAARKGDWALVAFDDAGREGWIAVSRWWSYRSWEDFLPGRRVFVLPGLRKGWYAVKGEPGERGADRAWLAREQGVVVRRIEGDWMLLEAPSGWFRWRDGDGRLTISLQPPK